MKFLFLLLLAFTLNAENTIFNSKAIVHPEVGNVRFELSRNVRVRALLAHVPFEVWFDRQSRAGIPGDRGHHAAPQRAKGLYAR